MYRVIFICGLLLLVSIGGWIFFHNVGDWLTYSEEPEQTELIICLNGNRARIDKAVEMYNQGLASQLLATNEAMHRMFLDKGVSDSSIIALGEKYHSTYEEARSALKYMVQQGVRSAVIVSDGYHMYRVKWTFEWIKDTEPIRLRYTSSSGPAFQNLAWWHDKTRVKYVLTEIPKVAYYWLGHGLLGIETDPHWVSAVESWYSKFLDNVVAVTHTRLPIS